MRLAISAFCILLLASACSSMNATNTMSPKLNDDRFATVQTGMTNDQVRAALGDPRRTMKFPGTGNEAWDYDGTDTFGFMVEYSVTFDPSGRVVSKLARRLNDGGTLK
jgi:outer membrane protein assembly factor BamE (lipoprotein component of BamABCDE complex)